MRAVSRTPVAPDRQKRVVTLPQAFEAHARATPAAAAVLAGDREVSYGEMNGMANRLAHRLAEVGVGPEQFVAVCARRSVDTLVAILAVLKAGGAFVPVDPADPQERLAAVIQDARPRAVLAGPQDQARFGGTETLWLDSAVGADESGLRSRAGPGHAACVYYTSGSTAEAKGVVLEHRAVLNQLSWVDRTLLGERSLALPLINRLPFAASLKQLFVPWLRGEAVRLVDDAIVGDPATLLRALSEQPLVALNCVPHLWHAMLQAAHAGLAPMPETLAAIWFAGESPTQSLLDRSFAALPDLEVWNVYAATESGISLAARIGAG